MDNLINALKGYGYTLGTDQMWSKEGNAALWRIDGKVARAYCLGIDPDWRSEAEVLEDLISFEEWIQGILKR